MREIMVKNPPVVEVSYWSVRILRKKSKDFSIDLLNQGRYLLINILKYKLLLKVILIIIQVLHFKFTE
jgi:hypothetical protein